MSKKTIIYLVILVVLAVTAFALVKRDKSGTIRQELRDFAVKDASKHVDKIFLADMGGRKSVLEKKNDRWYINGEFPANISRVRTLLNTIERVEVRNPVPVQQRDKVLKELAVEAIKVEIFSQENLLKTYYVGGTTHDEKGTMMMLENSSDPFVTHIPGFVGYLSSRYFAEAKEWRSRELFPVKINEITEVKIEYPAKPEYSFSLKVDGRKYSVQNMADDPAIELDVETARMYLAGFNNLQFENHVPNMHGERADSLFNTGALAVITVKTKGNERVLHVFPKPLDTRSKVLAAKEAEIVDVIDDPEKRWGIFADEPGEVIQVQNLTFDRIFRLYPEFATGF